MVCGEELSLAQDPFVMGLCLTAPSRALLLQVLFLGGGRVRECTGATCSTFSEWFPGE